MSLLEVRDLVVHMEVHDKPLLRGVDLSIAAGEALALVGESGSGKSLTTRAIMRLLAPGTRVSGDVTFDGRNVFDFDKRALRKWRSTEVAMVFQDPRAHINPVYSVGDFLREGLPAENGRRDQSRDRRIEQLLRDVGISDAARRLRQHPNELSGGLLQRVMIAAALLRRPRLLIADEPTTALDVTTQSDVMAILDEMRHERGMAMLFITHDLDLAAAVCDRVAVMYAGAVVESARAGELVDSPSHPYTAGLLRCRPELGSHRELFAIPGRPISGAEAVDGCAFAPRCAAARSECHTTRPVTQSPGASDRAVACHLWTGHAFCGDKEVLDV